MIHKLCHYGDDDYRDIIFFFQVNHNLMTIMKGSLIAGLMFLIVAPGILEAGPVTEEKENGEVVEW